MKKCNIDIGKASDKLIMLCWITLFACSILKLFGYKEFDIPLYNIEINIWFQRVVNLILYLTNSICFITILLKRKPTVKETVLTLIAYTGIFIFSLYKVTTPLCIILEPIMYFILGFIFIRDKLYRVILEVITISIIFIIYQILTSLYKSYNFNVDFYEFIPSVILQIDYYTLLFLTILNCLKKGGYIYGRFWKAILVLLSKFKGIKQPLASNQAPIQQNKETNVVGFKLFIIALSIAQISIVGVACYFVNNVILEYFIIIISFFIMRHCFGNSYHTDRVITCTALALFVFVCATKLSSPLYLTVFCNIIIGCLVAYIMYMWFYYIKYTSITGITLSKGMNKENLIELSKLGIWSDLEFNILCDYYVNRLKLESIAYKYNYSIDGIKKLKAKAIKKLNI